MPSDPKPVDPTPPSAANEPASPVAITADEVAVPPPTRSPGPAPQTTDTELTFERS